MISPSKTLRRPLKFRTPAEMKADVQHLQTAGYKKAGNWTLPQICWHLASTLEAAMEPSTEPVPPATPEQTAKLNQVLATGQVPPGLIAPPTIDPPASADDADIDRLITALKKLETHAGPMRPHRIFGPMSRELRIEHTLVHAAHHLSFLQPLTTAPMREKPPEYRHLKFADIFAAINEIDHLANGGYTQLGSWSLPQTAQHLMHTLRLPFNPPTDVNPTPEQAKRQAFIIDTLLNTGSPPPGLTPPAEWMPACDATEADVIALKQAFTELAGFAHPYIDRPGYGPVPIEKYRKVVAIHAGHHLGFLLPPTDKNERQTTNNR
jgi:Protein of unknown function (DUF1569)